jgi:hypothetical protein
MPGKESSKKAKKKGKVELTERKELSLNDKIKELKEDISKTKYNKKTQHAIGLMKAKLAMMTDRAVKRSSAGKASGDQRFSVSRTGDCTAVLLGFPSVGKSTLLNKITNAKSEIAQYSFTTLSAVPGLLKYKFAKIQIIDVPGIVSGAAAGKGRGREVLNLVRSADIILVLIDALYPQHNEAILKEIYDTGVRINKEKPYVIITKKARGGVNVGSTIKLTRIDEKTVKDIAREMRLNNADILIKSDIDADEFIDVIREDTVYPKSLTILTKIDLVSEEKLENLKKRIKPDICISAEKGIGIEELKEAIYSKMKFVRIFLKEQNKKADMEEPLMMFKGCTVKDVCLKLHKDFVNKFKFVRVWGSSAKFDGQKFKKMDKKLADKDIIEIRIS